MVIFGYLPEMTRSAQRPVSAFHNSVRADEPQPSGGVDPATNAGPISGGGNAHILCGGTDRLVQIVRINIVAGFNGSGWQRVTDTVQYAVLEGEGESV